jgi:hypothetical protein
MFCQRRVCRFQKGGCIVKEETRRTAGWLLIILPTVVYGGISLLSLLTDPGSGYPENPLRQDLWRAGHAHAGVLLILTLVSLLYLDQAHLSPGLKRFVRFSIPSSAIFLPLAFFFSMPTPNVSRPNGLISLAYVGAALLAAGLLVLGLIRKVRRAK